MTRSICFGLLVAALIAIPASADDVDDALAADNRHDYDTTITLCSKLLALGYVPQDQALILIMRGNAYLGKELWDQAFADFDSAVRLQPNSASAYLARGGAFTKKQAWDGAIQDLNKALRIDPDNAHAYIARGNAYFGAKQFSLAVSDYDHGFHLKYDDDGAIHGMRAIANFSIGQFSEAAADYEWELGQSPEDGAWLLWLHVARAKAGMPDDEFRGRGRRLDKTKWYGAVVDLYLGHSTHSLAQTDVGLSLSEQCATNFFLGEHKVLRKEFEPGRQFLQSVVDRCPNNLDVYLGAVAELKRL
jgi:tetratricopeptide (TPR) repeat protein